MKKRLLFVAAIFAATATFAQDGLTSKKGEAYLPEAGDWAIGVDANPLFNYVGNLANGTSGQSYGGFNWFAPNQAIYGKMFKDEKTAYRAMLRIGFGSTKNSSTNKYFTNPSDLDATDYVDEVKTSNRQIVLGFGIEKRRGNTRIQGVYGAQLYLAFGGGSTTNTYGLALSDSAAATASNNIPTSAAGARVLEVKNGSTFGLGVNGFIGVEWFFAPKVSLGAEYTWGLAMNTSGESTTTSEWWGVTNSEQQQINNGATINNHVITEETKGPKSSSFGLDTGISGASISLNFHF